MLTRRRDPPVPTLPAVPQPVPPSAPHENTAKALAQVTSLIEEVNYLREHAGRLRADLNIALMRIRDLEGLLFTQSADMEKYRRYSVEIRTHLAHIVDCCQRANEAALEAGDKPPADEQ